MRVIIDTNLWISCLIGKKLHKLRDAITKRDVEFVICNEFLSELSDVISRPKLQKYYSESDMRALLNFLDEEGACYDGPIGELSLCRDPKDDYLLELAIISSADFIVTGDKDLLELERVGRTLIITPMDFDLILHNTGRPKMFHDVELEYNDKSLESINRSSVSHFSF